MLKIWGKKDPAAVIFVTFTINLQIGETFFTDPTITSTLFDGGVDPAAQQMVGSVTIAGNVVSATIYNGIEGGFYIIKCSAQISSGRTITDRVILPVSAF